MKKFLIWVGIIALVVVGAIVTLRPNTAWRMYDSQLRALAMTEAEAFCVGVTLQAPILESPQDGVAECIATSERATEPSIAHTITWTCMGVSQSWGMPLDACEAAMEGYDLWPLLGGGFTMSWSDAWPRPEIITETIIGVPPVSPGERDIEQRGTR